MSSGPGQVVVVGRAQEAEPVGQHFEHAFREDEPALLGLRLEDLEDQLLLAHAGGAGDVQVLGDLGELLDAHVLQLGDVQALAAAARPRPSRGSRRRLPAAAACGADARLALASTRRGCSTVWRFGRDGLDGGADAAEAVCWSWRETAGAVSRLRNRSVLAMLSFIACGAEACPGAPRL